MFIGKLKICLHADQNDLYMLNTNKGHMTFYKYFDSTEKEELVHIDGTRLHTLLLPLLVLV